MNVNVENVFSKHVLKAIQSIRNSRQRLDNHTIFGYVTKNFATNAHASLIDTNISILLINNLIKNRPVNKSNFFFLTQTSSDFHYVDCKEKTNI